MKKIFVAAVLAVVFTGSAAYAGPNISAGASANVMPPISITNPTPLSFGAFTANTGGTIDSSGNVTGGVVKITNGVPGGFAVTGQLNTPYSITGDPSVLLSTSGGHPATMTAALTYPTAGSTSLDGTGNSIFNVAGMLTVGGNQMVGLYSGTYNVTVSY